MDDLGPSYGAIRLGCTPLVVVYFVVVVVVGLVIIWLMRLVMS